MLSKFYLGTHMPHWLATAGVPLFVSASACGTWMSRSTSGRTAAVADHLDVRQMVAADPKGPERGARPETDPLGTVRVHPDDDPVNPGARRKVKLPITREPGAYWRDLTPEMGTPPHVYSNEAIAGWPVQSLADVARALGHPPVAAPEVERLTAEVEQLTNDFEVSQQHAREWRMRYEEADKTRDEVTAEAVAAERSLDYATERLAVLLEDFGVDRPENLAEALDRVRWALSVTAWLHAESGWHLDKAVRRMRAEKRELRYELSLRGYEIEQWRATFGKDALPHATAIIEERDQLRAEVSRLREQLATAVVLPPYEDVVDAMRVAVGRKGDERDEEAVSAVLDFLRSWGVSSSEAPQPAVMTQHKVLIEHVWRDVYATWCSVCKAGVVGPQSKAELWRDQHEADILRPVLDPLEHDVDAAAAHFIKNAMIAEGRPSGSGAAAPHWREGDIAIDQTNFVHRRFEQGWRTWPRENGVQYGDALMESELGPMLRLDEVPPETDAYGHVPLLAAERARAAQAARSEATPKDKRECPDGGRCHHECVAPECFRVSCCGPLSGVFPGDVWPVDVRAAYGSPSPSLRKEGEDTRRPVYAHPDYDYEYDEEGERCGISAGWDLAFGCRVTFSLDEGEPYVSVSMSDRELRDGLCNRSVTREQIRGFAYHLIQMTEEMQEFPPSVSTQEETKGGETDG